MTRLPFRRLSTSVFTRLLVVCLAAGLAITVTVVAGFIVIRVTTEGDFERNLALYTEYLVGDLGSPPDEQRARQIARRTGMVIRFEHPEHAWQTGPLPRRFNLERAWTRRLPSGVWMGHSKGFHFIRLNHAGGVLTFIASRGADHGDAAIWGLAAMTLAMTVILGGTYFFIRRLLGPLKPLKQGVDAIGGGTLDHRIPETGAGELRDLARAFNTMAGRLARLVAAKEQLLLDVSHELRSPITRLKVQLEFLSDEALKASLAGDLAEMEAMVTTLLESARLRHAAAALNREPVCVEGLIRSLLPEFKNRRPGVIAGRMTDAPVMADAEKLRTVLRNLLDNALKHSPDAGPAVAIEAWQAPGRLLIRVADQGDGIPESAIPHLFEPFYRPDASRSRQTGGYGLGLSLCKAIVDAHGGTITLDSRPGQGTRVTVALPDMGDGRA